RRTTGLSWLRSRIRTTDSWWSRPARSKRPTISVSLTRCLAAIRRKLRGSSSSPLAGGRLIQRNSADGPSDAGGFSLIQGIVAVVIAAIAVIGLAHSFGIGRGLIDRFESARDGLGVAQQEMEILSMIRLDSDSLDAGAASRVHGPFNVPLNGSQTARIT